jgi:hypothetical protein
MRTPAARPSGRSWAGIFVLAAAVALTPAVAVAQYAAPDSNSRAIGEKYHVEVSGSFWNPNLFGQISSEQFGIIGSSIDFETDLDFVKTRFKDLRIVLRPSKKARFRIQYTPVVYQAATNLERTIVFNGLNFPISVPIESEFGWKVWRFGYEYDFIYRSRGFVGVLLEGRYTHFTASLNAPGIGSEFTSAKAPLPALGVVGRAYVLPQVAINFEVSGFRVPDIDPDYKANYFDWDINGTVNLTNNVGVQVGWRKMTTYLQIENDFGDFKFQGLWFGAALRY